MTEKSKPLVEVYEEMKHAQKMYDFCEDHKRKAGLGAALLIALVLIGSWQIGQDWRIYGRQYDIYEELEMGSLLLVRTRTVDNLALLGFLWVFIAVPGSFLADHIGFVQWVLMNWEPLPPNQIEERPPD